MKVDLEDVGAVLRKCQYGRIFELFAFVEFKLEMISMGELELMVGAYSLDVSALLGYLNHRLVGYLDAARDIKSL